MPNTNINNELINRITAKLETMAVPMDDRYFTIEEYRKVFPQGTVETPIGKVKIGKNQFNKLAEKDKGNRQGLIGAMWQTLSDPIIIIPEGKEDRIAHIFIKSFINDEKTSIIMSVVVTIGDKKIAISTYKRKKREVIRKIKMAGVMTYEKATGPAGRTGSEPRHY